MNNKKLKCRTESVYEGLRRGRIYDLISEDKERHQVTIVDSNGRKRKYPSGCFVSIETSLVELEKWSSVDRCDSTEEFVEVTLHLSNSAQRLLNFFTVEHVSNLMSTCKENYTELPSFILVRETSKETISTALEHLEAQDKLLSYSHPIV